MHQRAFALLAVLGLATAAPFAGEPSMWTVKITTSSNNCSKGAQPTGPSNSSVLEGYTGLYGCYAGDQMGVDYYVTCNATHMTSWSFYDSSKTEPCRGKLINQTVMPLGKCVDYDWTGVVTGQMYTYTCGGMWCNTTCDKPPCALDYPCPLETACCLNDPSFEVPCGTVSGCSGDYQESWFGWLLRRILLVGLVISSVLLAWKMGWCNICPWRRPYSTLYGDMA